MMRKKVKGKQGKYEQDRFIFEPVINDAIDTLNVAFILIFLFSLASVDINGNTRY